MPDKELIPVCEMCGQEILDDEIYDLDGEIICEDCLREHFHIDYVEFCRRYG
jgi:formylmethanofuran dehydrogenase subunit E